MKKKEGFWSRTVARNELRSWKRSQEVGWMFAGYVKQLEEKEARDAEGRVGTGANL